MGDPQVTMAVSILSHGHPWLGWFGGTPILVHLIIAFDIKSTICNYGMENATSNALLCMHGVYLKMRHARSCGHQIMRRCWSGWIIKDVSWSPWSITGHPRPSVQLNVLFQNPLLWTCSLTKKPSQALSLTVFLYNHGSSGIKIILSFRAAPSESSDRFR